LKKEHLARVEQLARQAAALSGVKLVDVEFSPSRGNPVLRLYIDKEGGTTLEDCTRVSRAMGDAMDTEDPIPFSYRLEVSSPGVDKALKGPGDYERYIGLPAKLVLRRPISGRNVVTGRIGDCRDGEVHVYTSSGEEISIRLDDVSRARLDVDPWEMAKMKGKRTDAG
jgi:ribosome maturation factor RimP